MKQSVDISDNLEVIIDWWPVSKGGLYDEPYPSGYDIVQILYKGTDHLPAYSKRSVIKLIEDKINKFEYE